MAKTTLLQNIPMGYKFKTVKNPATLMLKIDIRTLVDADIYASGGLLLAVCIFTGVVSVVPADTELYKSFSLASV